MNLTNTSKCIFVVVISATLLSCNKSESDPQKEHQDSKLMLGMSIAEVRDNLDANGVDLYFEKKAGKYVALDKEYEESLSLPVPASPTSFFMYRLLFDENDELTYANIEINGEAIELGEITLDIESSKQDAEQVVTPNGP